MDGYDGRRLEESRKLAMDAAKRASESIGGSYFEQRVALAAVYADIYRADAVRAGA